MKTTMKRGAAGLLAGLLLLTAGCGKKQPKGGFTPRLDTEARVELDIVGYFGNFEALDQVMNDFNQYYPNLTYTYQQVGGVNEVAMLSSNPDIDVMMTSGEYLCGADSALTDYCVDLSAEDVDLSDYDSQLLGHSQVEGRQLAIPMSQMVHGLVVNVSLLEKEGLAVPTNVEEFLHAMEVLKQKGYVPLSGPVGKVFGKLTAGIAYSGMCQGQPLREALAKGDRAAAMAALQPAADLLRTIVDKGYTDMDNNALYHEDNYDSAILRFFEGNVPFWACDSEKVGGMKKRESKSEHFKAEPFEYAFIYAPVGQTGEYRYREPWFGFAAHKYGDHKEYALEFLRFLATREELNKMAEVKGVPSAARESINGKIYENVLTEADLKTSHVNGGEVPFRLMQRWLQVTEKFATGEFTAQEMLEAYIDSCAEFVK